MIRLATLALLLVLGSAVLAVPPSPPTGGAITNFSVEQVNSNTPTFLCAHGYATLASPPTGNWYWRVDIEQTGGDALPVGWSFANLPQSPYNPSHTWTSSGTVYWHIDLQAQELGMYGQIPRSWPTGYYVFRVVLTLSDGADTVYYGDDFWITVN